MSVESLSSKVGTNNKRVTSPLAGRSRKRDRQSAVEGLRGTDDEERERRKRSRDLEGRPEWRSVGRRPTNLPTHLSRPLVPPGQVRGGRRRKESEATTGQGRHGQTQGRSHLPANEGQQNGAKSARERSNVWNWRMRPNFAK